MPAQPRYPYGTASAAIEVVNAARKNGGQRKMRLVNGAEVSATLHHDGSISWLVKDRTGTTLHNGVVRPRQTVRPARRVLLYLFAAFTRRVRTDRASPPS